MSTADSRFETTTISNNVSLAVIMKVYALSDAIWWHIAPFYKSDGDVKKLLL